MKPFVYVGSALVFSSIVLLGCGDSSGSTSGTSGSGGGGTGGATSSSTSSTGGAGPTEWGCVADVTWPAATGTMVTVSYHLVTDANAHPGIPDLIVKACSKSDFACATPNATGTTDTNGAGSVQIPTTAAATDGYLYVTSANTVVDPVVPTRIYWTRPIDEDREVGGGMSLYTQATLTTQSGLGGVTLDGTKGYMVVIMKDCLEELTFDATATVDGAAPGAFYGNGPFSTEANHSPAFFAVTPGQNDVVGTVTSTSETFGESTVTTVAGELTYVALPPTPLN